MSQNQDLTAKTVEALACAGTALERLEQYHQVKEAQDASLQAHAPTVAQTLIASGLFESHEKDNLERALTQPETTLELFRKGAVHHAQVVSELMGSQQAPQHTGGNASGIGTVVDASGNVHKNGTTKQAAYGAVPGDVNHPYAGARTSELTESDKVWYRQVLGYVPGEGG